MGLDMYLYRTKRVDGVTTEQLIEINSLVEEHDGKIPFSFENLSISREPQKDVGVVVDQSVKVDSMFGEDEGNVPLTESENLPIDKLADAVVLRGEGSFRWYSIFEKAGYWRKSNQIHQWFVENVQGGVDDCGFFEATKEQLEKLLQVVDLVLNNHSEANKLLPTQGGFFFGSTDYDEWYYEDLRETQEILKNVLASTDFERQIVFYHSSW